MAEHTNEPGGFLPQSLPSPAPSAISTTSNLPHPRSHPLKPGSAKEDAARRYVEGKLLHVSRRYAKKHMSHSEGDLVHGYTSMTEVSKDLSEIIDVLWLSGTPSLQVPYLLNIALALSEYLGSFIAAPKATFTLIRKLDHAFSSLLKGEDSVTGETLPGFESGRSAGLSKTDMVRIKSLVESTRVLIVEVMSNEVETEPDGDTDVETDGDTDAMSMDMGHYDIDEDDDSHDMDIAQVYESTMMQLGLLLDSQTAYDAGSR